MAPTFGLRHKRKIIGSELDLYIPDKQIAIEYNGVYWHTEQKGKHKTYHYDKWLACKQKGIQLIQIWEDDWNRAPDLIKTMLAHKIGFSEQEKVFARKTKIVSVSQENSNIFLQTNHIQGAVEGSIRVALMQNNTPVALMVLKKEPGKNSLNLLRYATAKNVIGGFTKLLKYVENNYQPEKIITFSDNTVSNGGLYENNDFKIERHLSPDYMYLVNNQRKHKFGYRIKRFKNDPSLQYEEGMTERELAALNNLSRIWDAGKIKWVKTVTEPELKT